MEQEDYIKRQIDQLGRVLGKILAGLLGLKSQGSAGDVAAELTFELEDVLPLNRGDLASMPDDLFLEMINDGRKFGEENLGKLAEILHLLGGAIQEGWFHRLGGGQHVPDTRRGTEAHRNHLRVTRH